MEIDYEVDGIRMQTFAEIYTECLEEEAKAEELLHEWANWY